MDSFLPCKHLSDLEILVINDDSTDHIAEIVSCYEKRYPGIIYLINKENSGHGSTLNKSLELASGQFYKAVDGDDWGDASWTGSAIVWKRRKQISWWIDTRRFIRSIT